MSSHVIVLPLSKERHNEVASELPGQNLGEEVDVGHEGTLQYDWDVRGVEQLNWVWLSETSHLSAAQTQFNAETLEVDDYQGHDECCNKVAQVWSILSVESLLKPVEFVWFGEHEMEQGDDASLEFSSLICSNSDWGE